MKILPLVVAPFLIAAQLANAADDRYSLTEYTMNQCPACVAALKDVAAIIDAGIDVRCLNTDDDPQAREEAARFKLKMRPAWRLARADGKEVARWYGAGCSALIVATIQAKFPTPDAVIEEPKEEPQEETDEDASESEPGTVVPPPTLADPAFDSRALMEELDAAKGEEDFRNRTPVVETFEDVSFLDRALDEWNDRDEEEEEEEDEEEGQEERRSFRRDLAPRAPKDKPKEEPKEDAALGDRIADRAASRILEGLNQKADAIKAEALAKLDGIGEEAKAAILEEVQNRFADALEELKPTIEAEVGKLRLALLDKLESIAKRALLFVVILAVVLYALKRALKEYADLKKANI